MENKTRGFLWLCGLLFFISFYSNFFKIVPQYKEDWEKIDISESLLMGKLAANEVHGLDYNGGFPMQIVDSAKGLDVHQRTALQYKYYLEGKLNFVPQKVGGYYSQLGGQGRLYAAVDHYFNMENKNVLALFSTLNALLLSLTFCFFIGWAKNQYGFFSALFLFVFLFFSSWIAFWANNTWWCIWTYLLPFTGVLLYTQWSDQNKALERSLYILMFVLVLIKTYFTGFEFISTTLIASGIPLIYYFFLHQIPFKQAAISSLKLIFSASLAMASSMGLLAYYIGKFRQTNIVGGFEYILWRFKEKTKGDYFYNNPEMNDLLEKLKPYKLDVFVRYLGNDAFELGFLENGFKFKFLYLIVLILVCSILMLWMKNTPKNRALFYAFCFAFFAPASWYIFVRHHSSVHTLINFFLWYMPFLLYGFLILGVFASQILDIIKSRASLK